MTDEIQKTNTDPKKIIQLGDHFKTRYTPWIQSGIDALNELSPEQQIAAIEVILNYVFMEVKVGLGLVDPPEDADIDMEDLTIFNRIANIYEEAAGGCYFCSEAIDPNETPFVPDETLVCLICSKKLKNFAKGIQRFSSESNPESKKGE